MMGVMLPTTTSPDIADLHPDTAILPTGSFEQHGRHLPLTTDSLIATAIAERLALDYNLFLLPVLTFGCSHEHAGFPGTVSISAHTLGAVVSDIFDSLVQSGVDRLVLVNAHGGNYVLGNVVQEGSANGRRMALFPQGAEWQEARDEAGLQTSHHDDMHAGEAETSILLYRFPDVVHDDYTTADHLADDRRHLLTAGVRHYAPDGVIGRPSLASPQKGDDLLRAFSRIFKQHLAILRGE
jgi:creatinine amidohydrolase